MSSLRKLETELTQLTQEADTAAAASEQAKQAFEQSPSPETFLASQVATQTAKNARAKADNAQARTDAARADMERQAQQKERESLASILSPDREKAIHTRVKEVLSAFLSDIDVCMSDLRSLHAEQSAVYARAQALELRLPRPSMHRSITELAATLGTLTQPGSITPAPKLVYGESYGYAAGHLKLTVIRSLAPAAQIAEAAE